MKKQLYLILSLLIISCSSVDEDDIIDTDQNIDLFSTEASVVGYFPWYRFSLNNKIYYPAYYSSEIFSVRRQKAPHYEGL